MSGNTAGSRVGLKDNNAFVAFVASKHGRRLRQFLTRRLPNPTDAHDLAQEVYLRLLRVQRDEQVRNPEAYLLTVASHLVHEHAVKQASHPPAVGLDDPTADLSGNEEEDPGAHAESQQRIEKVERALSRVSANAAAVLILHRRDGFTLDEIAVQLGVSRSMTKKYLVTALTQCRRQLRRAGKD
jgi:RNA polymerase sigma factor (sigma-70 family)